MDERKNFIYLTSGENFPIGLGHMAKASQRMHRADYVFAEKTRGKWENIKNRGDWPTWLPPVKVEYILLFAEFNGLKMFEVAEAYRN